MILDFITWNVDPELFSLDIFGFTLAPRWYGLLFAAGFFFGYIIMLKFFKKEGVPEKVLETLTTYMLIATVLGARLGHVLFYQPDYYFAHPGEILKIWEGGLASHGAAAGILIAIYIFSIKEKRGFLWAMDRIVIVTALAAVFIRTGNLINSEIYGHITTMPWGFKFIRDYPAGSIVDPRHPTQIYEAIAYLITFIFLYKYYWKKEGKTADGYLLGMFLIMIFGIRFFIEFLKEDQVGFEAGMVLNMGQLLSIPLVLGGAALVWRSRKFN
jgi:prolipoprotein diacylglyceryl transferase